jgi:hypothetical protein
MVQPAPRLGPPGQNGFVRLTLPAGRSRWAIAAGLLGLLSIVVILAPLGLLTRLLGQDLGRAPERPGGGRAAFALIAGGVVLVAAAAMIVARTMM